MGIAPKNHHHHHRSILIFILSLSLNGTSEALAYSEKNVYNVNLTHRCRNIYTLSETHPRFEDLSFEIRRKAERRFGFFTVDGEKVNLAQFQGLASVTLRAWKRTEQGGDKCVHGGGVEEGACTLSVGPRLKGQRSLT